ncbi:hypothetical protein [Phytoactinopolyspora limicola]|uniref:hypothetical protein n=1 Tax=Phytoactinopolyspora limicola TaxID=2715536 RepID=UPI0014085B79|nr:hypothetical protein [Phytoactinopolyspora limicola]
MNIEDLVRRSMNDMVRVVPPRPELADQVLRGARRRQQVTRMAVAGGASLVVAGGTTLAVADPLGLWENSDVSSSHSDPGLGPADESSDAATDADPDEAATDADPDEAAPDAEPPAPETANDVVDLDDLSSGAAPDTPWYADGTIHLGDTAVPFDADFGSLRALEPVNGGAAVLTTPAGDEYEHGPYEVYLVGQDGTVEQLADSITFSLAVSPDGSRIAWAEHEFSADNGSGPSRTVLNVADATTGELIHTREQTGDEGHIGGVMGFLEADRLVLDSANNSPDGVYVWEPTADTISPWTDFGFTQVLAPSGEFGVFVPPNEAEDSSSAVVDTRTEQVLWSPGEDHVAAFSPDGRYAAVVAQQGPPMFVDGIHVSELQHLQAGDVIDVGGTEVTVTDEMIDAASGFDDWRDNWDGRSDLVLVDARTGDEVLRRDVEHPGQITWESAESVVFAAWQDGSQMALVRCTVAGACELATEPVDTSAAPDGPRQPYDLGGY